MLLACYVMHLQWVAAERCHVTTADGDKLCPASTHACEHTCMYQDLHAIITADILYFQVCQPLLDIY